MNTSNWQILIVEDEHDSVQMISKILDFHGIEVHVARDGNQCIALLDALSPTLVVMDLAMPEKDGWQTLVTMRSAPDTADIPVVAVTAYHSASVAEDAVQAGFDAYYTKPIDPSTFVDSLGKVVSVSA